MGMGVRGRVRVRDGVRARARGLHLLGQALPQREGVKQPAQVDLVMVTVRVRVRVRVRVGG